MDYNINNPFPSGFFANYHQDGITVNLIKEDTFDLGKKKPYYSYGTYPIEIDIAEIIITSSPSGQYNKQIPFDFKLEDKTYHMNGYISGKTQEEVNRKIEVLNKLPLKE